MNYSITEISNVLELTGERIIDEDAIVNQLLTDSRSLTQPEETIFFALRTDAGDGHNYIPDLFGKGVRNFKDGLNGNSDSEPKSQSDDAKADK